MGLCTVSQLIVTKLGNTMTARKPVYPGHVQEVTISLYSANTIRLILVLKHILCVNAWKLNRPNIVITSNILLIKRGYLA